MTGFTYQSLNTIMFFETDSKRKTKKVLTEMMEKINATRITRIFSTERLKVWINSAELEERDGNGEFGEYFQINGTKYLKRKHKLIIL